MTQRHAILADLARRIQHGPHGPDGYLDLGVVIPAMMLMQSFTDEGATLGECQLLGTLHWLRYTHADGGLPHDRFHAVRAFTPLFLAGAAGVPEPLRPDLADAVEETAWSMAGGRSAPDPDAAIELWDRIVGATTTDHSRYRDRVNVLAGVLSMRGTDADWDRSIVLFRRLLDGSGPAGDGRAVLLNNLGSSLLNRFERHRDAADVTAAVAVLDEAASCASGDNPALMVQVLSNRADARHQQCYVTSDPGDLSAAIAATHEALAHLPSDRPGRHRRLANLGLLLMRRGRHSASHSDIDQAIIALREATADPDGVRFLADLAAALHRRSELTGRATDRDIAIEALRTALASPEPGGRGQLLNNLGSLLGDRATGTDERPGDLDEAITVLHQAYAAAADLRPITLNLGLAHSQRFGRRGGRPDLDEAITFLSRAVAWDDIPERSLHLGGLGDLLRERFGLGGGPADLAAAERAGREAVALAEPDGAHLASLLSSLGSTLVDRHAETGVPAVLDEAIQHLRAATVHLDQPDDAAACWHNLAIAYRLRHERLRPPDEADLAEAVTAERQAVAAARADDPRRGWFAHNLASMLISLAESSGDRAGHDEAIDVLAKLVDSPADADLRRSARALLGTATEQRFRQRHDPADALATATLLRAMLADPAGDSELTAVSAARLSTIQGEIAALGAGPVDWDETVGTARRATAVEPTSELYREVLYEALVARFRAHGDLTDIDEAIGVTRELLAAAPTAGPLRAHRHLLLSEALQERGAGRADPADLDAAVAEARHAVAALRPDEPDRPRFVGLLGSALAARFNLTGNAADLDEAIAAVREGDRDDSGFSLAYLLWTRSSFSGRRDDIDQAIDLFRASVAGAADPNDGLPALTNLSCCLAERYRQTGAPADLDEAVTTGRQAVAATLPGARHRSACLSNLARALEYRYHSRGDANDRREAVTHLRSALAELRPGHPDYAQTQSSLGTMLDDEHDNGAERIAALRAGVEATPAGSPHLAGRRYNLSHELVRQLDEAGGVDAEASLAGMRTVISPTVPEELRAGMIEELAAASRKLIAQRNHPAELDEAVSLARSAAAADVTDGHRVMFLDGLAEALTLRFQRSHAAEDLHDAIAAAESGLSEAPPGHPLRGTLLKTLGDVLAQQCEVTGDPRTADRVLVLLREATEQQMSPVSSRFLAAERWGRLAMTWRRRPDALAGYHTAVALVPLLAWHGVGRDSRERMLTACAGLATAATASALEADRPASAVEAAETGRAVLWTQLLDRDADLARVAAIAPDLAAAMDRVRGELSVLDAAALTPGSQMRPRPAAPRQALPHVSTLRAP